MYQISAFYEGNCRSSKNRLFLFGRYGLHLIMLGVFSNFYNFYRRELKFGTYIDFRAQNLNLQTDFLCLSSFGRYGLHLILLGDFSNFYNFHRHSDQTKTGRENLFANLDSTLGNLYRYQISALYDGNCRSSKNRLAL